ncbi:MAG: phosphohistidine phosphatase SixA [Anaerolineae bacterium]|nr:phosphohistidine phosphatase SixA [Anaerolineae bacterium]
MRVILVRHGKASKDPKYANDDARPLTKRGQAEVTALAEWLGRAGITVHQIRHSGLLRAQQTAEIFAKQIKPAGGVVAVRGLLFDDPVDDLARELALETEPVMLVGHNPFIERLTATLLRADAAQPPVSFATSSAACLDYVDGYWTVRWVLHRELTGAGGDAGEG